MKHDLKAPSVGESITEVRIANWKKQNGEAVKNGEVLVEIESDKATVEVVADRNGVLFIQKQAGEMATIGEVLAQIDDAATASASANMASSAGAINATQKSVPLAAPTMAIAGVGHASATQSLSPSVRKMTSETGINPASITGSGKDGRITKGDVIQALESGGSATTSSATASRTNTVYSPPSTMASVDTRERRVPMSLLRQKIAERLVMAQHTAAILTTFNECDMSAVNEVRAKHKENFKTKYGVSLSYMSFFTRAVIEALKEVPAVNAVIDGKEMVYRDYYDIGVAVGTERGLVVPVIRDAGKMGFVDIEKAIGGLALKARDGKLSIADLSGGTFTISNGGTYGSLLSTPILNPPQSGILGMHKIQDRPMVVNGQVVVRPMMYLALSYDHRIIDGKEAVTFLIKVKEGIENPTKLGLDFT